jgi:hypothetical protein
MDPLHPLVPIQPPAPMPPTYNRVERIERDPPGDSGPDWQRDSEDETEEDEQQQFEDDYDPEWSDPAAVEPYGPDGVPHDAATAAATDPTPAPKQEWNPRIDGERRSHPRNEDDDAGPDPGPHIDISA